MVFAHLDHMVGAIVCFASRSGRPLQRHIATIVLGIAALGSDTKAIAWEMDSPLSTAEASFLGEADRDAAGESLANAGDVNGDGLEDVLVGAWHKDGQFEDSGRAYLLLGRETGWVFQDSVSSADASFVAEQDSALAGYALSGDGDVNGDGIDDFLVGSPQFEVDPDRRGLVGLYFGSPSAPWGQQESLTDADVVIQSEEHGYRAGKHIAANGDLNGDGLSDILVSDGGIPLYPEAIGRVYLVFGMTEGWPNPLDLGSADVVFQPPVLGSLDGDVASGADVNGDGIDDVLIKGDNMVHLFFGRSQGWGGTVILSEADSFLGIDAISMAMGDVNGDGLGDVLIGHHNDDDAGEGAGQAWLFLGRTSGWYPGFTPEDSDASWTGEEEFSRAGFSVSSGKDVNGDGLGDLLVGAPWANTPVGDSGQAYLIFGRLAGWANDVDLGGVDASFLGEAQGDDAGQAVAFADLNGDSYHDIVIGSYSTDESEGCDDEYLGETYIVFGHASCVDADGDGFGDPGVEDCDEGPEADCDDTDPDVFPGQVEDCDDSIDNDCDGDVDSDDPDCPAEDDDSAGDDDTTGDDDDDVPGRRHHRRRRHHVPGLPLSDRIGSDAVAAPYSPAGWCRTPDRVAVRAPTW